MNARLARFLVVLIIVSSIGFHPRLAGASSPEIVFSISGDVSSADESYVREGIAAANDYLLSVFGVSLRHNLAVNIRDTAYRMNPGVIAFAAGEFLVVFTGAPGWEYLSPSLRLRVIFHEFIHIFEYDMIGGDKEASPMWIIEGIAEYVSFEIVLQLGILKARDVYDAQTWAVSRGLDYMPPLYELENIGDFQNADGPVYSLSYLAIDELAGKDVNGRLRMYFESVASGSTWQAAFLQAFGTEPEEFYERFLRWLVDGMYAPAREPASFRPVSTKEIDAGVAITNAPERAKPGEQIVVIARTEPSAGCRFELREADGDRISEIRTIADATGLVFWLVTIPTSFSDDDATIVVGCGGERDRAGMAIAP